MKLREAKRLVKAKAITTYERVYLPVYYVTMMMQFHSIELRATGVAICQPEDEWRPVVGAGIARSKAIAQLVQQVMTLDGIERKRAAMVETERCIDECLADMTRRYETAQAAIKAASPYTSKANAEASDGRHI